MQSFDEQEEGGNGDAHEDESMFYYVEDGVMLIVDRGETEVGRCGEASSEG